MIVVAFLEMGGLSTREIVKWKDMISSSKYLESHYQGLLVKWDFFKRVKPV